MTRRLSAALLIAVVFTIILSLGLTERSLPSASAQSQTRWEYAELSYEYNFAGNSHTTWEDPQTTIVAAGYPELAKKLGSNSSRQDSTALLNYLGGKGWELVNQSTAMAANANGMAESIIWTFKRRR